MGNAWTNVSRYFSMKEARVLILGLDAAGKTTILYQMKLGEVVTTIPTIGFNVETVVVGKISLTAWDVGGRDKIRPLWRHYYQNTSGLIFVVDSNDRERIDDAREQLNAITSEDELQDLPILIFANKQDLPNAMSVDTLQEALELSKFDRKKVKWHIQPSTATENKGITEGFQWLSKAFESKTNLTLPIAETVNDSKLIKKDLFNLLNSLNFKTVLSKFV